MASNEQSITESQEELLPQNNNTNLTNEDVIKRIEEIINETIESLEKDEVPTLSWKYNHHQKFPSQTKSKNKKSSTMRVLQQSRGYTSIFMIFQFVHTLLISNRTTTTREVYYYFVTHFNNQRECDNAILDAARLLGVSRIRLGLAASPKGWYCGNVIVETTQQVDNNNNNESDQSNDTMDDIWNINNHTHEEKVVLDGTRPPCIIQGIPITREWIDHELSSNSNVLSISSSDAKCILVIEKEGIYTRLSEDRFYNKFPCILVTGRGFPDLATRALVYNLYHTLNIPVIGLCDCNPFGISVLTTFICGSERLGFDQERYSVPMHWLGLRPSHVQVLRDRNNPSRKQLPDTVFQKLTPLDKKRMQSLWKSYNDTTTTMDDEFYCCMDNEEEEQVNLSDELSIMKRQGYKLELEALHWLGMDFLSSWLLKKLQNCRY